MERLKVENRGVRWRGQNTAHEQGLPGTEEGLPDEGGGGSSKGASVKCLSVKEAARPVTVSEDSLGPGQTWEGHPQPMSWEAQQSGRAQNQRSSSNASVSFQR